MNDNDQTNVPPVIAPASGLREMPSLPIPKPLSWWLRKIFACNPFYLVSAALLLYGCYRVSIDAPFLNRETARLVFNFTSVQTYEIVLVLVAIFLARRSLWYDSTLLTGLENLLVFVPFILISLASLIDPAMTYVMCGLGAMAVILRFGGLKRFFTQLNLPDRLLGAGFIVLVLNVALPLSYRFFEETKYGAHLEYGPAFEMNERVWLLMLPIVLALANFLPRTEARGNLLPQHRWLPEGLFALWFTVTCVHLYALDYVYEFYMRSELFAPAVWVLAWTVFLRIRGNAGSLKFALLFPALLTPLVANSPGSTKTYLILAGLNLATYAGLTLMKSYRRFAPHLLFASSLMLVAGLPDAWIQALVPGHTNGQCIAAAIAVYVIIWAAWLRNPTLAVFGAVILGCGIMAVFHELDGAGHWALQGALVFVILHSLRWTDAEHTGATAARLLVLGAWTVEAFVWMGSDAGKFWMPFVPGVIVLAIYCTFLPGRGIWRYFAVPTAACVVIFSGPCMALLGGVRSAPVGLLAVVASFVFLGFGTVAALTRHLWHKPDHELDSPAPQTPAANR